MIATTHKTHTAQFQKYNGIMVISAWGFAMVISSFLFLWVGYKLDQLLGTEPNFMLGLFMLAVFICVMRLYQEARKRINDV